MDNNDGSSTSTEPDFSSTIYFKPTLKAWSLLSLFSVLILFNYFKSDNELHDSSQVNIKYVFITCPLVSISFSMLVHLIHLRRRHLGLRDRAHSIPEYIVSFILVGLWGVALPQIMDPSHGLAQMYVGKAGSVSAMYQVAISNANIFVFTWGIYFCVWDIWLKRIFILFWCCCGRNSSGGMGWMYTRRWSLLAIASSTMLHASVTFEQNVCHISGGTTETTCKKNKFIGIGTGLAGTIISLLMKFLSICGNDSALMTSTAGTLMTVIYVISAYHLVFGDGPATYMCNQYFAAWAGLYMSSVILGGALKEFLGLRDGNAVYTSTARTDTENETQNETQLVGGGENDSNDEHLV